MSITGSTTLDYLFSITDIGYGEGKITMEEGLVQPIKIFEIESGSFRKCMKALPKLIKIKAKCTQIAGKSLLVPLYVDRYRPSDGSNSRTIRFLYAFDYTFAQSKEEGLIPLLFQIADNGIIDPWWGKQTVDILDTVSAMHGGFLYHTNLDNVVNYVCLDKSICIIMPNVLATSKDDQMANNDLVALGSFLSRLANRPSVEWNDFVQGFGIYPIRVLKKHPVLKNSVERFEYVRALLTRLLSPWDNQIEDWNHFRRYIKKANEICPNWASRITGTDYKNVYFGTGFTSYYGSNYAMLQFVEHAMKHADANIRTMRTIDLDLHKMFPYFSTKLHSLFANYSILNHYVKVFP